MNMKSIVVTLALSLFLFSSMSVASPKMLVRVYTEGLPIEKRLPRGLDIAGAKRGEWVDVVIAEEILGRMVDSGFRIEIISYDVEALESELRGDYHDYQELVDSLEAIAATYPNIAMLETLGTTYEGRDILALKISDNVSVDEDETEVLFVGLHHAREWPTLEICLFCIDTLTGAYGVDPNITQIVDSRQIWIVPCENPDGYVYCHDQGHDWRKNRRYFPEFGTYGVDPNRNYGGSSNGVALGEWGSIPGGTSHSASSSVYCGPSPASEAETQVMVDLILAHDFIFGVSYHTYGEMVIWSWGYTSSPTDDSDLITDIGEAMASRISVQSGAGTYDAFQSSGLYCTSGDFDDWSYGHSLYCGGKNMLSYTVEMCNQFHPHASYLDQIVRENFDGAFYLLEIADSIAGLLTPRVMPPVLAELDTSYTGSYTVIWSQTNPAAFPDYYQLDELTGFSVVTDDAESGSSLWETERFMVSSTRYYSSSHSYFSNLLSGNNASSMTTIWPLPVSAGDSLSFWCWYDIETNWDYAYVEVALEGREWDILDEFTGSSGWVRKVYSLDAYAGKSIFIRFRYITDDYTENEGFYVDDIDPVPHFDGAVTLSSSIADTTYPVNPGGPGQYWYMVKGHNNPREWGDWSQLEDILVMAADSLIVESDTLLAGETDRTISIIGVNKDSVAAYSIAFCYDTTVLFIDSLTLQGTRGEGALSFEWTTSFDSVTADVVYSGSPPYIPPGSGVILKMVVDVSHNPASDTTFIHLSEGTLSESLYTILVDGMFVIEPIPEQFIRGDADADSALDMSDAVSILRYLYIPGTPPSPCMDASDVNDDSDVQMSDPVYLLRHLYVPDSPAPPPPFPGCGVDPSPDMLDCGHHPCWNWPPESELMRR